MPSGTLPLHTIHQPSLVGASARVAGDGQDVSFIEEEVSGGVAYRCFCLVRLAPRIAEEGEEDIFKNKRERI